MQQQKQNTFKVVLTGPESSGKTTLAAALARHFNTNWTPEFARFYLQYLGRPYQQSDLEMIGKGQSAWENWYGRQAQKLYFCDTDWTVLHVWEAYKFETANEDFENLKNFRNPERAHRYWKKGYADVKRADLYLLCAPDFPWESDPLRENPTDRDALFDCYEQILLNLKADFLVLRGAHEQRLEAAISQLAKLFSTLP